MATWISLDIEADGPVPGLNSMLSLGAVAIRGGKEIATWGRNLEPLPDARQDPDTMKWWEQWPEQHRLARLDTYPPEDGRYGMRDFVNWCEDIGKDLVAVAWPAAFDFAFVNWYCHRFVGRNPLGFACLDIRSYIMGATKSKGYRSLEGETIRSLTIDKTGLREHIALDDAIEQGRIFMAVYRAFGPPTGGTHA